ncbi:ABC transporter permease subunit [Streptomyces litmocidini]|uniref:ABC transporter permease subunit n=1 Tax=Streptomyces litmocidini TaxID=67318 RepID=UPI0036F7ED75
MTTDTTITSPPGVTALAGSGEDVRTPAVPATAPEPDAGEPPASPTAPAAERDPGPATSTDRPAPADHAPGSTDPARAAVPAGPEEDVRTPASPAAPVAGRDPAPPAAGDLLTAPASEARRARRLARALARGLKAVGLRSAALLALLAVWEAAPRLGLVDATFLPPVSVVGGAWWELLGNGQLVQHTSASLARSLGGFGIAVAVAVPLGLLIGWYRPVAAILGPLLEVFRNTAALALLPVFVLLLGIGETSKVSIVVYACVWPILLNTISAVGDADPTLVRLGRSMDLSTPRLFQKVILPASVPAVFTGIRLAGAVSVLVLVAAEMIGAKAGLGYLINASQFNFAIPQMYAGIVTISAIGVAFNQLLITIERRLSLWRVPA